MSADAYPHSRTTERQVLAAIARDPAILTRYEIADADFYEQPHRAIRSWLALEAARSPVTPDVLIERLFRAPIIGATGTELADASMWLLEPPDLRWLPGVIEQLRADRVRRDALRSLDAARERLAVGHEGTTDVLSSLADDLRAGIQRLAPGTLGVDLRDALSGLADTLEARRAGTMPVATSTGSTLLDDTIGGLHPGDLVVLAAPPAVGKTSVSLSWCASTARAGIAAAFFSVEMLTEQLAARVVSEALGLPGSELRGVPSEALVGAIRDLADSLDVPVRLWCGRYTPGQVCEQARGYAYEQRRRGTRLGLVVVDYLQILRLDDGHRGRSSLSEITGAAVYALKDLALELGCTVVAVSQLSRQYSHRDDKRPTLTDLRNSGDIEAAADLVLGLYRDEVYHPDTEDRGLLEVIPLKSRHHELGIRDTVPLRRAKGGGTEDYSPVFVKEWRRQREKA